MTATDKLREVVIGSVGAQGDGVGLVDGRAVFVAGVLAGERVLVRPDGRRGDAVTATAVEILDPSPRRMAPVCRHFGDCGGCGLQHMAEADYAEWKRGLAVTALTQRGLGEVPVAALDRTPPGTRRRAAFAFVRHGKAVTLGFNARNSHRVVDLAECPLLVPSIVALLEPLRGLLRSLASGASGDVVVGAGDAGLDLIVSGCGGLDLGRRERLARFAEAHDLARLSWRPSDKGEVEPVICRRLPRAVFSGIAVNPPPGCFLQPSAEGEAIIVRHLLEAVAGASPVADLHAGAGSLTFPLAVHGAEVHAVDGAAGAIAALRDAAHRAGLNRVTTEVRDLAMRPLSARELARFQAVVFDPPRIGAKAQAEALAEAGPPVVVAVSCNPATLARDARILVDGGYRLERVVPVDQFPWSPHLELVASFRRDAPVKRRPPAR